MSHTPLGRRHILLSFNQQLRIAALYGDRDKCPQMKAEVEERVVQRKGVASCGINW